MTNYITADVEPDELARHGAATCLVGDQLFVWRGDNIKHEDNNSIYVLNVNSALKPDSVEDSVKRWKKIDTKPYLSLTGEMAQSEVPPGNCGVAMCSVGEALYTFGGWVGHPILRLYRTNALHKLELQDMLWRKVEPVNPKDGPGMKDKCGMVVHDNMLCIFGGYGYETEHQVKNNLLNRSPGEILCWTSELHLYDLDDDKWIIPECSGTPPAPCAAFTFTKVDQCRVMLFGGRQCEGRVNEIHILNMEQWVWSGPITQPLDIDPWPIARSLHTAVCLQDPDLPCSGHRQLLVLWGMNTDANPINDLWMLDIDQMQWRQIPFAQGKARVWHSTVAYYPSQGEAHVLTFGGNTENIFEFYGDSRLSDVVKMEFGVRSLFRCCVQHIRANMNMYTHQLHLLPTSITQYICELNY